MNITLTTKQKFNVTVYSSSSSFSALKPFTFGLGFPHNKQKSVLYRALVFHPFTPNFFKANSISSIHFCLGLPYIFSVLLVGFPVASLLSFHRPFLHHTKPFRSTYGNYSYSIARFIFITNLLIRVYSSVTISICWPILFFRIFLSHVITAISSLSLRVHDWAPLVLLLFYGDLLLGIFSLLNGPVHGNIYH